MLTNTTNEKRCGEKAEKLMTVQQSVSLWVYYSAAFIHQTVQAQAI